MTREEALSIQEDSACEYSFGSKVYNINDVTERINKIYDGFAKEQLQNIAHVQIANELIEKLQNRKCEECRYNNSFFNGGFIESHCEELGQEVGLTFYCKFWEAKNAK